MCPSGKWNWMRMSKSVLFHWEQNQPRASPHSNVANKPILLISRIFIYTQAQLHGPFQATKISPEHTHTCTRYPSIFVLLKIPGAFQPKAGTEFYRTLFLWFLVSRALQFTWEVGRIPCEKRYISRSERFFHWSFTRPGCCFLHRPEQVFCSFRSACLSICFQLLLF